MDPTNPISSLIEKYSVANRKRNHRDDSEILHTTARRRTGGEEEVIEISDDDCDAVRLVSETYDPEHMKIITAMEVDNRQRFLETQRSMLKNMQYVDSSLVFEMAKADLHQRNAMYFETAIPDELHVADTDPRFNVRFTTGDRILADIYRAFDLFPMKRSYLQRILHRISLNVIAGVIYGEEWRYKRAEVMRRNGWKDLINLAAVVCPRRFGKTVGAAMLAAVLMLCVPEIRIACFAPTLRQAITLLESIVTVITQHPYYEKIKLVTCSKLELKIIGVDGTLRTLTAYASSHKVCKKKFSCS